MYSKTIIWITVIIIVGVAVGLFVLSNQTDTEPEDNNQQEQQSTQEEELAKLPLEITVRGRTVEFDTETIEYQQKSEYASLPYEVAMNGETRLIEGTIEKMSGESPVEFVKRFVANEMPSAEELNATNESMYTYTASFHSMSDEDLEEYPIEDRPDAPRAEEGVVVYIRGENFADDSVGGEEHRLDFIVLASGGWHFVWHGERTLCRRIDAEYWQPADQLCP